MPVDGIGSSNSFITDVEVDNVAPPSDPDPFRAPILTDDGEVPLLDGVDDPIQPDTSSPPPNGKFNVPILE